MTSPYADLPRVDDVPRPARFLLHPLRGGAAALLRRRYGITTHHADRVPVSGPVILAANHTGLMDGPLLAVCTPRPVHALTKAEMFAGRGGVFLRASGQIELDRFHADPSAVKQCVRVLREGGAAGIFPEGTRGGGDLSGVFHRGAAYLALVTGAPVVPLTMLGTRAPGAASKALPPRRGPVDLWFGESWRVDAQPWPRTRSAVAEATDALHTHMTRALDWALSETGRSLPGPLPHGVKETA